MKLNETQISTIENVLEKLGVVYIDYKFEILDHIATEVEELMQESQASFEDSFVLILKKWEPKFKIASSTWFGYFWEMPEILMQKAKKLYKRKMIFLIAASFVLATAIYFAKEYLSQIFDGIWYFFVAALTVQFFGYVQIRRSRQKTTFGFLYKQQFLGFLFLYFQQLFSLHTYDRIFEDADWTVSIVFLMTAVLLLAPITSFMFYKEHFKQLNRTKNFI